MESADQLNTSSASLYAVLTGQQKEIEEQHVMTFCNVVDVGTAHVLAVVSTHLTLFFVLTFLT
jgi:hypothetical protein